VKKGREVEKEPGANTVHRFTYDERTSTKKVLKRQKEKWGRSSRGGIKTGSRREKNSPQKNFPKGIPAN